MADASSNVRNRSMFCLRSMMGAALCLVGLALWPAIAQAQPTAVAHWSFDTSSLTIDAGNITGVDDVAGAHDATVGTGGTGGGDGMQYLSAPFVAATSSVSGPFGQALQFGGNNFLLFNNLTELMAANGGPSYTVSMWVNVPSSVTLGGADPFATFSNWGNQPASAGPTRFTFAFGPAGNTAMRGQSRRNEPGSGGGGTNGDDIFARNGTTPTPINDAAWHMLSWTFDTTTGVLSSYFDATLVDTFTSTDPSFALGDSSSTVAGIGIKGDNGVYTQSGVALDEIWAFNSVLTSEQVETLYLQNGFGPPPILGDTDGDGVVELEDFDPIRDNFRKTVSSRIQGDLVRNNFVDFNDFREWKVAFVGGGGSLVGVDLDFLSNVPEPSTTLLMLVGGLVAACFRQRRLAA